MQTGCPDISLPQLSEMDTPPSISENNRSHILGLNYEQTLAYCNILHTYNGVLIYIGDNDSYKFYASAKFETVEDMLNFQMRFL
jgi:hypothetical protein